LNTTARRADSGYNPIAEFQPWQFDFSDDLPAIPVLPETLLLLDLEAQERSVDLKRVAELVLSDLGATLQILRLAGREHACAEFRPSRIEDCIVDLGVDVCLQALSAHTVPQARGPTRDCRNLGALQGNRYACKANRRGIAGCRPWRSLSDRPSSCHRVTSRRAWMGRKQARRIGFFPGWIQIGEEVVAGSVRCEIPG
jgi:hypothetical protein